MLVYRLEHRDGVQDYNTGLGCSISIQARAQGWYAGLEYRARMQC